MCDVIDWDEKRTGTRREGIYFAWWNLLKKLSAATGALAMGWVLDASGFEPNVEQRLRVKLAIAGLFSVLPMVGFTVAAALFSRYSLEEAGARSSRANAALVTSPPAKGARKALI